MYRGQTQFRPPTWQLIMSLVIAIAFPIGTVIQYQFAGLDWISASLILFSAFGVLGLVETLTTRLELTDSELLVSRWFRQKSIARARVVKVTWAAGVNVSIRLDDDSWVKLPEVGNGSQALCNSIRAWINAK